MFCPGCGQKLEDNMSFCTNCGMRIPQARPDAPLTNRVPDWQGDAAFSPAEKERKKKLPAWTAAVFAAAAVLLIFAVIWILVKPSSGGNTHEVLPEASAESTALQVPAAESTEPQAPAAENEVPQDAGEESAAQEASPESTAPAAEDFSAYEAFLAQVSHSDEWIYDIEKFALYDVNRDGVTDLITLGGGRMDYFKVHTMRDGIVETVIVTSMLQFYDNGVSLLSFTGGNGNRLYSYFMIRWDFSMDLIFRYAEWYMDDPITYAVGEEAYDETQPRVPYAEVEQGISSAVGGANVIEITYIDNTESGRAAVFG